MASKMEIFQASDESMARFREIAGELDVEVIDRRTAWRRWRHRIWVLLCWLSVAYFMIADYCRLKWMLGLATTNCGCS